MFSRQRPGDPQAFDNDRRYNNNSGIFNECVDIACLVFERLQVVTTLTVQLRTIADRPGFTHGMLQEGAPPPPSHLHCSGTHENAVSRMVCECAGICHLAQEIHIVVSARLIYPC